MFCKKCGTEIDQDARFCCCCGTFVERSATKPPVSSDSFSSFTENSSAAYGTPIVPAASVQPAPTYYGVKKQNSYAAGPVGKPAAKSSDANEPCAPLTMWEYVLYGILFSIPLVNLILAFIWGFSETVNPNKRNLSRAMLIFFGVSIVLCILYLLIMLLLLSGSGSLHFRF
ncbi:MAG: zinc ribbon domain-containing protein [Oscillospiraceae bacterium]|nr:zinc ribbon domain-containing protein [Oscillospiraceae bacterium]